MSAPVSESLLIALIAGFALIVVLSVAGRIPLRYNVRNLVARWRTTLMTALAFTLVVALSTVMLAFVAGMERMTEQSGHPENVIVLSDGATDELFSNLGYRDASDVERQPGVKRDAQDRPLCSRETYVVVNQPIEGALPGGPQRRFMQVRGIEDPLIAAHVHQLQLLPGGAWFSTAGVQADPTAASNDESRAQVIQAVIGEGAASQWGADRGKPPLVPGDTFELGARRWVVTGVIRAEGSTFGSEIWAKRALIAPMFGKETYSSIVLRTDDANAAKALATALTTNFKKAALQAQTETEYFAKLGETTRQFLVAIVFVTVVMSIGGVFGVMNTMFAAISQRSKDIGVLRIIGYSRWQILVSFLLESLLISLVGGGLGCLLGSLVDGYSATSIMSSGQGGGKFIVLRLFVSPDTLVTGLVMTLGMGAIGGLLPSLAAMRLRPLESLR